ncbi:hypothetical protein B4135_2771 [Caldibacillus debilis]|uniref:Uncharacterized protein n=1 Tax=Caldibacillus debilis TaxID=301148 RepID=A0A150LPY3_9BACI|nr:hypothetical protein B4135_2771 [Caldibacillus debilis]
MYGNEKGLKKRGIFFRWVIGNGIWNIFLGAGSVPQAKKGRSLQQNVPYA